MRRNPPNGKGTPHSADYAAPKQMRQIKTQPSCAANPPYGMRLTAFTDMKQRLSVLQCGSGVFGPRRPRQCGIGAVYGGGRVNRLRLPSTTTVLRRTP